MKRVTMGHGAGGELMQELIAKHIVPFLPRFKTEVPLDSFDDSAVVDGIVFTTDAHTVKPLFFPGGDIGSIAICGTVNDISVMGGEPLGISSAMILEEGLDSGDDFGGAVGATARSGTDEDDSSLAAATRLRALSR